MKIEHKYRAWDKDKKKIRQVTSINWIIGKVWFSNLASDWNFLGNVNLLQYINLKDKDGKEIYEGDVCKTVGKGYLPFEIKIPDLWKWIEGNLRDCEIIGNIYENPELLSKS